MSHIRTHLLHEDLATKSKGQDTVDEQIKTIAAELKQAKLFYSNGKFKSAKEVLASAKKNVELLNRLNNQYSKTVDIHSINNNIAIELQNKITRLTDKLSYLATSDIAEIKAELKSKLNLILDPKSKNGIQYAVITSNSTDSDKVKKTNAERLQKALYLEAKTLATDDPICVISRILKLINDVSVCLTSQTNYAFSNAVDALINLQSSYLNQQLKVIAEDINKADPIEQKEKEKEKLTVQKDVLKIWLNAIEKSHTVHNAAYARGFGTAESKKEATLKPGMFFSKFAANESAAKLMNLQNLRNVEHIQKLINTITNQLSPQRQKIKL